VRHAIAVSSGTAALHLAFRALALTYGDEVVMPAFNFVAAANTVLQIGSTPRFADTDSIHEPVVSARTLDQAITPKTRGICVMHYGGYPCSMDSIMDLARSRNLWVVEDAAHAPGAAWKGIPCGRWGDISCFSFFGNKNISCAEGGMVTTENDALDKKLRLLRSHGMDSLTWDRVRGHSFSYDVAVAGLNCRLDDIRAALLRIQLRSLNRFNRLREERVQWYRQRLGNDSRWIIPFSDYPGTPAYHLFPVVLGKGIRRKDVMSYLKTKGIQSSIHYPPIHRFTYYQNLLPPQPDLKNTNDLGRRILSLPLFPDMSYEQVKCVCDCFRDAIASG
jgi:dTDP-4-amino-4,6-dideoxygalactose transaminase